MKLPAVLLITPWYGGSEGGVAVVAESLTHALLARGVTCIVIEVVGDGWLPRNRRGSMGEQIVSLCVRDLPSARGVLARFGAWIRVPIVRWTMRRLMRESGPCVAHFHYSMPEYDLLSALCREWRVPVIATFHGSDLTVNMAEPRTFEATTRLVESAHAVTTVSGALRQTLLGIFPRLRDRAVVVHNSVPPHFAEMVREQTATPRDIDVLFVGNLIPRKGVDILLASWRHVLLACPTARLTIAGDGESAAALRSLAVELGLDDTVVFIGRQARTALPAFYRRAKILVVPSRAEPLGVVVLEGQLSGAAVIASATGGLPEVIVDGMTGLLVPPEDPAALACAITTLLSDATRLAAFSRAGHDRVAELFSPERVAEQYERLYAAAVH